MGCSPYFAATGTHPLLLIDIVKANYLLLPLESILSSTDLITWCVITLQERHNQLLKLTQQVYQARVSAAIRFEKKHWHTIHNYDFQLGDLVLFRNTAIKKALNCKMWPQYLGPLIVISRNKGGTYIVLELDGSIFNQPVAAFWLISYSARQKLKIPPLEELINISQKQHQDLKDSQSRQWSLWQSLEGLLVTVIIKLGRREQHQKNTQFKFFIFHFCYVFSFSQKDHSPI